MVASSTTASATAVAITPPAGTAATDFDKFVVTACAVGGSCLAAIDCLPANVASCAVTGLSAGTVYSITAAAAKGTATGVSSVAVSVTTVDT